jgi:hypothetical protein
MKQCFRQPNKNKLGETTMNLYFRLGAPATAISAAAFFGALTTGSAIAGEYCRQDVTGHMTSCSYSSMEQCQAMSAGIGGDCFRDPNLGSSDAGNAFAHAPKASHTAKHGHKGKASDAN